MIQIYYTWFCPGKKLNKNTVGEVFKEAGIKDPDLYRICEKLGIKLKHPPAIHTEGQNDPKEHWEKFSESKHDTQDKGNGRTEGTCAEVVLHLLLQSSRSWSAHGQCTYECSKNQWHQLLSVVV